MPAVLGDGPADERAAHPFFSDQVLQLGQHLWAGLVADLELITRSGATGPRGRDARTIKIADLGPLDSVQVTRNWNWATRMTRNRLIWSPVPEEPSDLRVYVRDMSSTTPVQRLEQKKKQQ